MEANSGRAGRAERARSLAEAVSLANFAQLYKDMERAIQQRDGTGLGMYGAKCEFGCHCEGCVAGGVYAGHHCDDCWDRQYSEAVEEMLKAADKVRAAVARRELSEA